MRLEERFIKNQQQREGGKKETQTLKSPPGNNSFIPQSLFSPFSSLLNRVWMTQGGTKNTCSWRNITNAIFKAWQIYQIFQGLHMVCLARSEWKEIADISHSINPQACLLSSDLSSYYTALNYKG